MYSPEHTSRPGVVKKISTFCVVNFGALSLSHGFFQLLTVAAVMQSRFIFCFCETHCVEQLN